MVFYFTATGNSLSVAKRIDDESLSIPQVLKNGTRSFAAERIGLVFPCYHGGVPRLIERFLSQVKLDTTYLYGIVTYGAFSGGAATHLRRIGERYGLRFAYINELLMVNNYLPMYDMDRELAARPKKRIDEQVDVIVSEVANKTHMIRKSGAVMDAMRWLIGTSYDTSFEQRFVVNDNCIACGICAKVCPVANITVIDRPVYANNCQHCLACVHHCPHNAIDMKKQKSEARFINDQVRLSEIMAANNVVSA